MGEHEKDGSVFKGTWEDIVVLVSGELVERDIFKIEKIISDSRCPEGVQCVRAGEVKLTVGVYENNLKTEEVDLVIDYMNFEENKSFFESKIPLKNKKIDAIQIFPKSVSGVTIEEKEYKLKLVFSEKK